EITGLPGTFHTVRTYVAALKGGTRFDYLRNHSSAPTDGAVALQVGRPADFGDGTDVTLRMATDQGQHEVSHRVAAGTNKMDFSGEELLPQFGLPLFSLETREIEWVRGAGGQ